MKNNDKFEQMKRAHELKYPLACQKLNFSPQNTMHQNAQNEVSLPAYRRDTFIWSYIE